MQMSFKIRKRKKVIKQLNRLLYFSENANSERVDEVTGFLSMDVRGEMTDVFQVKIELADGDKFMYGVTVNEKGIPTTVVHMQQNEVAFLSLNSKLEDNKKSLTRYVKGMTRAMRSFNEETYGPMLAKAVRLGEGAALAEYWDAIGGVDSDWSCSTYIQTAFRLGSTGLNPAVCT